MGLRINRKTKEPAKRELDLSSTSAARRYLTAARKHGTPEQAAEAEKRVAEQHPDMLLERRRV
ncbi:MAG: hypothetical protein KGL39_25785 [Patescibacteria group bacterium]|nr:hypothetical protein [Patescibacteria group bacterium]